MIYKSTSIDEVIGRVIRNTRIQDSSYIMDMIEWIPEAMGYMKTKVVLHPDYEDVNVNFHVGKLPCKLDHITAVEWNGYRIRQNTSSRNAQADPRLTPTSNAALDTTNGFVTVPTVTTTVNNTQIYGNTLVPLTTCTASQAALLPRHDQAWYDTEMDYLQFSVADTVVRVHYKAIPVDKNGLPLIPDEENYKQALYFYVRMMMQGAGYEDKVYTIQQLNHEFEVHAARAMGKIRYPSVDSMDMKVEKMTRLIPDANYFSNFFGGTGPEKYYGNTNVINIPNV